VNARIWTNPDRPAKREGIVPKDITMGDIYRSVVAYTLVELDGLVIIMLFPQIALWLPNKLL
jgi:TRAP-type mannitol/chloroaromatic compound transport system permease large subunit